MEVRAGGISRGAGNSKHVVGYNSSIYAAKAGQVIISEYSKSYGHYVVVYHGAGLCIISACKKRILSTKRSSI